ncbi:hypothetical protein EVAR_24266_1 [Eumeta japonica]|uniref:Uncharacterized protein n=1 Tax=Eumeta variegata TaxID=151549 RepID=A0A4C1VGJ9_EUMVA|nr:hypothetical protein EVAR_24266_1 [Eumeta japonica]
MKTISDCYGPAITVDVPFSSRTNTDMIMITISELDTHFQIRVLSRGECVISPFEKLRTNNVRAACYTCSVTYISVVLTYYRCLLSKNKQNKKLQPTLCPRYSGQRPDLRRRTLEWSICDLRTDAQFEEARRAGSKIEKNWVVGLNQHRSAEHALQPCKLGESTRDQRAPPDTSDTQLEYYIGIEIWIHNRISDRRRRGLMERGATDGRRLWGHGGGVGRRNSNSLDETQQWELLFDACILALIRIEETNSSPKATTNQRRSVANGHSNHHAIAAAHYHYRERLPQTVFVEVSIDVAVEDVRSPRRRTICIVLRSPQNSTPARGRVWSSIDLTVPIVPRSCGACESAAVLAPGCVTPPPQTGDVAKIYLARFDTFYRFGITVTPAGARPTRRAGRDGASRCGVAVSHLIALFTCHLRIHHSRRRSRKVTAAATRPMDLSQFNICIGTERASGAGVGLSHRCLNVPRAVRVRFVLRS